VYEFLSGVPVTPVTSFVDVRSDDVRREYLKVVHYMRYALAAYGWPMYMMTTGTGLCRILPRLRSVAHGVRFGYWTTRGCHRRLCVLSFRSFGGICETANCPVRDLSSPRVD